MKVTRVEFFNAGSKVNPLGWTYNYSTNSNDPIISAEAHYPTYFQAVAAFHDEMIEKELEMEI